MVGKQEVGTWTISRHLGQMSANCPTGQLLRRSLVELTALVKTCRLRVTDLGSMGASTNALIRSDSAVPPRLPPETAKAPGFPGNVPGLHSVRPRVRAAQIYQPFERGVPSYA